MVEFIITNSVLYFLEMYILLAADALFYTQQFHTNQ